MDQPDPILPPLLSSHPVAERAFDAALDGARGGKLGAGDLVWARSADKLDCALVLEPDVPAERAAEMLLVALVAFGDSLGALAPPEVGVTYGCAATIRVNGGRVGAARIAMAAERDAAGAPAWMVVGLDVALRRDRQGREPGADPEVTDLAEEGCGDIGRSQLLESFSRHLLAWIHTWQDESFRPVRGMMLFRADDTADRARLLDAMDLVEIAPAADPVPR